MTVLVSETWGGAGGVVNGKVPTSGGGTWQVTGAAMNYYGDGTANSSDQGFSTALHSASYTNVRISAGVAPRTSGAGDSPLYMYARSNGGNTNYELGLRYDYYEVKKNVSGVTTNLSGNLYYTVPLSQVGSLYVEFQVAGSTIRVIISGVTTFEITDTSITGPGQFGFATTWTDNGDQGSASNIGTVIIQTPYLDVTSISSGRNVVPNNFYSIGSAYLGTADIALVTNSLVAAISANTTPANATKMNNASVIGTGTTGDSWRGVGVSP